MPSPFVDHLLKPLGLSRPPSPVSVHSHNVPQHIPDSTVKQSLRLLLVSLNQPLSDPLVNDTVASLIQLEQSRSVAASHAVDNEEDTLRQAIIAKLVVGLYSEGLDICISQATKAEMEAEWWADIERSRRNVAWYLLQSILSLHPTKPFS